MAIDALQRDIFTKLGVEPGNYVVFAEQAENLFMPSSLFALDEYGVPVQTAQRLASLLLPSSSPLRSLDTVLARLLNLSLQDLGLTAFEIDILEDVRRTISPQRTNDRPPDPDS